MEKAKNILHRFLPKLFRGSHVAYFGAAAVGWHGVYASVAGVLVFIIAVAYALHIELE